MIQFLLRKFVPRYEDIADKRVRRAYGMLVSVIGIILNFLLAAGKLLVGLASGLVSIQADAFNNLSDAGSCLVSLVSFRIAAKPADRDHPFGHARMEYVSGMIMAFLILMLGVELLKTSASTLCVSIFEAEKVKETAFSLITAIVLGVSVFVKLWLSLLNRKIGKRIGSSVMRATAVDSLSDALCTTVVLVAAVVEYFVDLPFSLDGLIGIFVSLFIFVAGVRILRETWDDILGKAPDKEIVNNIINTVHSYEGVYGIHDLCIHQYGAGTVVASLHIEVDGKEDVYLMHDMIDNIEQELLDEWQIQATIHMDPIVIGDKSVDDLKEKISLMVSAIHPSITIHDFRLVQGPTHSNLLFDIAVPFEVKDSNEDILSRVERELLALDKTYRVKAKIDRV
ncbi:MAG: cation transporter [Clostridia bacterium]|nr:cation transporter [Clostridia bacterium]